MLVQKLAQNRDYSRQVQVEDTKKELYDNITCATLEFQLTPRGARKSADSLIFFFYLKQNEGFCKAA